MFYPLFRTAPVEVLHWQYRLDPKDYGKKLYDLVSTRPNTNYKTVTTKAIYQDRKLGSGEPGTVCVAFDPYVVRVWFAWRESTEIYVACKQSAVGWGTPVKTSYKSTRDPALVVAGGELGLVYFDDSASEVKCAWVKTASLTAWPTTGAGPTLQTVYKGAIVSGVSANSGLDVYACTVNLQVYLSKYAAYPSVKARVFFVTKATSGKSSLVMCTLPVSAAGTKGSWTYQEVLEPTRLVVVAETGEVAYEAAVVTHGPGVVMVGDKVWLYVLQKDSKNNSYLFQYYLPLATSKKYHQDLEDDTVAGAVGAMFLPGMIWTAYCADAGDGSKMLFIRWRYCSASVAVPEMAEPKVPFLGTEPPIGPVVPEVKYGLDALYSWSSKLAVSGPGPLAGLTGMQGMPGGGLAATGQGAGALPVLPSTVRLGR